MALTILLAKVLGITLIAAGLALIAKRGFFEKITRDFLQQDLLRVVVAVSEMIAGLFIAIGHNVWSPLPAAIITVLGWIMAMEGASYLLLPRRWPARFIGSINRAQFFVGSGAVALVIGIYLASFGFGLWPRLP